MNRAISHIISEDIYSQPYLLPFTGYHSLFTSYQISYTCYLLPILFTFYQLPFTSYLLPTFPVDNQLSKKALKGTKFSQNFGLRIPFGCELIIQSFSISTAGVRDFPGPGQTQIN